VPPLATVAVVEPPVAGATLTGATPVPCRVMLCGVPGALSASVSVPERTPVAVGVKTNCIWQALLMASVAPQLLVSVKSPAAAIELIASGAFPELVSVTGYGALAAPCVTMPNSMLEPDRLAAGATGLTVKP
jgi:hypothetical protein